MQYSYACMLQTSLMMDYSVARGLPTYTSCPATSSRAFYPFSASTVLCVLLLSITSAPAVPLPNRPIETDVWGANARGILAGPRIDERAPVLDFERDLYDDNVIGRSNRAQLQGLHELLNSLHFAKSASEYVEKAREMRVLLGLLTPPSVNQEEGLSAHNGNLVKRGPRFSVSGDLQVTSDFLRGLQNRRNKMVSASNVYQDLKSVGRK